MSASFVFIFKSPLGHTVRVEAENGQEAWSELARMGKNGQLPDLYCSFRLSSNDERGADTPAK